MIMPASVAVHVVSATSPVAASIVFYHLLLSGDVELNPGPTIKCFHGLLLCTLLCIVTMVQSQTQENSTSPTEADGGIDNGTSPAITTSPTEADGGYSVGEITGFIIAAFAAIAIIISILVPLGVLTFCRERCLNICCPGPKMSLEDQSFQEGVSDTITINVDSKKKSVPDSWVELTIVEKPNLGPYSVMQSDNATNTYIPFSHIFPDNTTFATDKKLTIKLSNTPKGRATFPNGKTAELFIKAKDPGVHFERKVYSFNENDELSIVVSSNAKVSRGLFEIVPLQQDVSLDFPPIPVDLSKGCSTNVTIAEPSTESVEYQIELRKTTKGKAKVGEATVQINPTVSLTATNDIQFCERSQKGVVHVKSSRKVPKGWVELNLLDDQATIIKSYPVDWDPGSLTTTVSILFSKLSIDIGSENMTFIVRLENTNKGRANFPQPREVKFVVIPADPKIYLEKMSSQPYEEKEIHISVRIHCSEHIEQWHQSIMLKLLQDGITIKTYPVKCPYAFNVSKSTRAVATILPSDISVDGSNFTGVKNFTLALQLKEDSLLSIFLRQPTDYTLKIDFGSDIENKQEQSPHESPVKGGHSSIEMVALSEGSKSDDRTDVEHPTTQLQVKKALDMLKACEDKWPEFMDCVEQIRLKIKLEPLNGMLCKLASEVTSELDEERQGQLKNKVPNGFVVGKTTGNGDCLFNAASIALFGDENLCDLMRLASVFSAVEHFDHYCKKYTSQYEDNSGDADAFVSVMASCDESFNKRPVNGTVAERIQYIIKKEAFVAAKTGSYSGFLQVQFLATALKVGIQQHKEGYDIKWCEHQTVFPCCMPSQQVPLINIMWVKFISESSKENHVIPLFPQESIGTITVPSQ